MSGTSAVFHWAMIFLVVLNLVGLGATLTMKANEAAGLFLLGAIVTAAAHAGHRRRARRQ